MSLPGDLTTCAVVGTYLDSSGAPVRGRITFTPSTLLADATGSVVIPPVTRAYDLSAQATFETDPLVATDSATISPQGWTYQVVLSVAGLSPQTWSILLPASGSPVDISTITPAVPQAAVSSYATSSALTAETARAEAAEAALAASVPSGSAPVPIGSGGTNATSAGAALTNLGAASATALTAETTRAETAEAVVAAAVPSVSIAAYGALTSASDNGPAINSAVTALGSAGGIIYVPPGTFRFSTPLALQSKTSVTIQGLTAPGAGATMPSAIEFTGTGSGSAIDAQNSNGVRFRDLAILYNSSSFTGNLLDYRNVTGSDTSYGLLDNCYIGGAGIATANILVALDKCINMTIRKCNLAGAAYGIYGKSSNSNYSNAVTIQGCVFHGQTSYHIYNAAQAWVIDGCTFEGLSSGTAGAYGHDSGNKMDSVTFRGNWTGDTTGGTVFTVAGSSVSFTGNYIGATSGTGISTDDVVTGLVVTGNDFAGCTTALETDSSSSATGWVVAGNSYTGVTTRLAGTLAAGTIYHDGQAQTGSTGLTLYGANIASPVLTGTPTAPTATALTDSTQIATTAYADAAVGVLANVILAAPIPSGDPTGATDAANLQAAITSVGSTTTMRAVRIYLAPGNYIINSTLLAQKKSIELIGCGWGAGTGNGIGTTITWTGSAATPMVRLRDCFGSKVSRIKFINGATAASPSAAISMYNLSGDTNGSSFNLIEQCWFGQLEGFDSTPANPISCGVLFEGDNVNDDQSVISGCVFYACSTGVQLSNPQNVINKIQHCYFYGCGVGVSAAASVALDHTFMASTTSQDLNISNSAIVTCTNYSAEASAQMALIRGGSQLLIKGGYWQIRNALTGSSGSTANVVDALENTSQSVKFEDYRFVFSGYTNPATPQIAIGQVSGGTGTVQLVLENCSGITDTPSTTAVYPFLQSGGNTGCHLLLEGSVNGGSVTNAKQRFRIALDEVTVGFTYALTISFGTYNVPGGAAIGTQVAYAKVTSNAPQALTAATFTLISTAPQITLPNDGHTYKVELTVDSASLSTSAKVTLGIGPSTSVMYGSSTMQLATTLGGGWGSIAVAGQKVTGTGQTVSVYALCASAFTVTLGVGAAAIELAAYRVA